MQNSAPNKREQLIDELLGRKEFVELWVMKWAELLQIRTVNNRVSYKSMLRYYNWLQERIQDNVPMDQMVQELLAANGGTFANAATNYYQAEQDTLKTSENVAQVFMGMRIQCAQCHNHPFDRWTMDDYYSFAAFFSQIGRKRGEDPRELDHLQPRQRGSQASRGRPRDGTEIPRRCRPGRQRQGPPRSAWPNGSPRPKTPTSPPTWRTSSGRTSWAGASFTRWTTCGFPIPPSTRNCWTSLAKRFTDYNYDFKKLVRDICLSRTYQLSTATNETNASDDRNFSHANLRRMRAEMMLDSITQVTDTKNKFQGLPLGARAVQIANGNTSTYFLTTFGRASRETVCSCEVKVEPNLSQALHMLNGDTANSKIQQGKLIENRLSEGKKPEEILEEVYIRCLSRKPNEKERASLTAILAQEKDPKPVLEDVFWALIELPRVLVQPLKASGGRQPTG